MLQHHLLIAFRNAQRHKASFFINLAGLSTGLACVLLICLWVFDETGFDRFHQNAANLYQVLETSTENGNRVVHEATQGPLAEAMAKDLPEVQTAVPVMSLQKEGIYAQLNTGLKAAKKAGIFAGNAFFQTFSFPLLQGSVGEALKEKNTIVLADDMAKSLFGSAEAAMGKALDWELMGDKRTLKVAGVFAPLPRNNSMTFDFVLPYTLMMELAPNMSKWWNEGPSTYLLLKPGTDLAAFNQKIQSFTRNYDKGNIFTLSVRPYADAYLYNHFENGKQAGGRIDYVRLFSLVALFILVIACINFMNLATARASRRMKEVGIKKAVGSSRRALVWQFLSEAVFVTFLSLVLACFLAIAFLPLFSQITGKELHVKFSPGLLATLLGVCVLTGLFAGSYPAFYLSGFRPVAVLKGKLKNSAGELLARKGLVVFQFVVSVVLIVSVVVVQQQVAYVQAKHLGYDRENVVSFDKEGALLKTSEAFLTELRKQPGIAKVSAMQSSVVRSGTTDAATTYGIEWPGKRNNELINFSVRAVDDGLLETLGIPVKEGRSFSDSFADKGSVIFNEAAIRVMGLQNPIGARVKLWGEDKTIVGVVNDFHLSSLHDAIAPMLFFYNPERTPTVMARIKKGREKEALAQIETLYKKFNPGYVFNYRFLDDAYQAQYVSEQRVSLLARCFAGLAILISCLGLFGLAAFNAEVRKKEIGIRKVLGASVQNVVLLLSKDFLRLILLALVIALPLAWWAVSQWLQGFAYHIRLSPWIFMAAAGAVIAVAFLTLSYQSIRTAVLNPAKSLRTE